MHHSEWKRDILSREPKKLAAPEPATINPDFRYTSDDVKFLRVMRVALPGPLAILR